MSDVEYAGSGCFSFFLLIFKLDKMKLSRGASKGGKIIKRSQ